MTQSHDSTHSLEQLGWRQCSIIEGKDVPGLDDSVSNYADDDIFIVLPYSCAVVQMDFSKEPFVEIFRVRRAEKKNKGWQFGREPRWLQVEIEDGGRAVYVNGTIHDRFFVGHELFLNKQPNPHLTLSSEQSVVIRNWVAKRYIRHAFPTEFNKRAGSVLRKLRDKLKGDVDIEGLLGVYIDIDPCDSEQEEGDAYDVDVFFLVEEASLTSASLNDVKTEFEGQLRDCEGIYVSNVELRSETDMLLSEYKRLVRVDDYDFISYRDDHGSPEFG
ncbi:MAG: hypothetical protein OQK32_05375 [Gammaproteobacteria bacterium]|nr:hypothetical protein [Gammaproteobacteria bacterium]MCW8923501.1 hypothetical protein [Gammaproteobacteria bacterium]